MVIIFWYYLEIKKQMEENYIQLCIVFLEVMFRIMLEEVIKTRGFHYYHHQKRIRESIFQAWRIQRK